MSSEMNITPFIDVLLVLLVIFMLSIRLHGVLIAQLARQENGPGSGRAIVLELTDDGRYLLNTVPVAPSALDSTLRAVFAPRPDKLLYFRAAPRRTYGEMIAAMDVARGAGVTVLGWAP